MTPLPPPLGTGEIRFWRLDRAVHAPTWDQGEGAFRVGGRWNSPGVRAVYNAIDPATAILEVAVHKGFATLDTTRHVMTSATVKEPGEIYVLKPADVPNPHWLNPGAHGPGQQSFGDELLKKHVFVLAPSAVSQKSWNLIFEASAGKDRFEDVEQETFALDPRLHKSP